MNGLARTLTLAGILVAAPAGADSLELNISDDSARAGFRSTVDSASGLEVGADWLHHQDDGNVFGAGMLMVNDAAPGRGALDVGIGAKLFHARLDSGDADGTALGLGGRFHWTSPDWNRLAFAGHGYFAPDVTAGGDIDRYTELAVRTEYAVLENAHAYLGYRNVRIGNERTDDTETFDSAVHLGLRLEF
ncbi:YfaZ family outer membrane protein [Arhodomonas sp. SL1]|uniref:YfaZ family outer membrane protein n=1 Tax=Arhodomonas sp. SL1 TaxID=3425691 RepID=UPI003F88108B